MIKATISKLSNGDPVNIKIMGHAASGEYGHDVMCAAVSTLSVNLINSLEHLAAYIPKYRINDITGGEMIIDFSNLDTTSNKEIIQLLFESFLLGMTKLSEDSPEYVKTSVMTN
ncbi:ribosomal-processing cysteine protease Prp [Streptococcus sp. CSL10205-OR2]|uniref:ribosomal-processing cysteine protease Prp n=1 Tax=Streptococcus sp. CSL10205-OR2 TaxID=2980558 RepID=UPI0021DA898A|nr:ribosomal-processing cysteine protease Prp [Streptococcus sp. CSL10205-OR2]MCU9534355.1 ribosomal-processing cysteine protease Prp [Streptococcus sp. CSL10205-OR2]